MNENSHQNEVQITMELFKNIKIIYISRALRIYLVQDFSISILQISFTNFIFLFNLYLYSSVSAPTNFKLKKEVW